MDFSLSDDQAMLRDSVARYLDKEYDFAARTWAVQSGGHTPACWAMFAELGWTGACLSEAAGGYGGGPLEAMVIMEEFGRRLVVEPFVWTVIVGGQLLQSLAPDRATELTGRMIAGELHIALAAMERHSRHAPEAIATKATQEANGWRLDGVKAVVPNGALADMFFVTALVEGRLALFAVNRDMPGLTVVPFRTQDGHNAAEIRFDQLLLSPDALVARGDQALEIVERAGDHGRAALCAEAIGSASHLLVATTAYLKQREQYGAPLARLQVLQHRLAEMYVATEMARSMAISAALSLDLPAAERQRAIAAARVQIIQGLRFVTQQAVQLHGGMGISEELDIAHHLKRAVVSAILLGDEDFHLNRFMALEPQAAAA